MLTVYGRGPDGRVKRAQDAQTALCDGSAVWADLIEPTEAEEATLEGLLEIDAPTPAERAAIEESARFYEEDGALVLTATLLARGPEGPKGSGLAPIASDAVTFILHRGRLVTVRAIRPRAFEIGAGRASARIELAPNGAGVLLALLDAVVERLADHLQDAAGESRKLSDAIFKAGARTASLDPEIRALGRLGGVAARCQESLASLQRLVAFCEGVGARHGLEPAPLRAIGRDLEQLSRTAASLQENLTFLLDASLGLVSARQNNALKALSVATIAFVPPTLIASIFGMNFDAMSWHREAWGPWVGFGLMLLAPVALFAIAKRRGWF